MKKLWKKIVHSKRISLFISLMMTAEMPLSSIAVAYYLLVALFPMLLVAANVLPYLNINTSQVLEFMRDNLPKELYSMTNGLVRQVLSQPNSSLLIISIVLALWMFSKALTSLQMAMNKAYGVSQHRDIIIARVFSILIGFVMLMLLYLAVAISTFGQTILTQLYVNGTLPYNIFQMTQNLTLPFVALVTFIILLVIYATTPNIRIKKFRYILPGAVFSMLVLVLLPTFFGQYVNHALQTVRDFKLVGSLVIFALMIWFIFIARVIIIGAMLNASYQRYKEGSIETRRGDLVQIIQEVRKDREEKKEETKELSKEI